MSASKAVRGLLALGAFVLITFAISPFAAEVVQIAGRNIPQSNMHQDYLIALAWATALGLGIVMWPVPRAHKGPLGWVWLAKCQMTLGFMLYYEWNYELDAFYYWGASRTGAARYASIKFGDGTSVMHWLTAWHGELLIRDSYHATKISFAFIGLIAIYLFYRAMVAFFGREVPDVLLLLGVFPSCLQWSSILGKDPIVLLGISLYVLGTVNLALKRRLGDFAVLLVGVAIASSIRPWSAMILLAPLVLFILTGLDGIGKKLFFGVLAAGVFAVSVTVFSDGLKIRSVDDAVERSQQISVNYSAGAGSGGTSSLAVNNSPEKMLAFAPIGALSALFRPLPGEINNAFGALAGLENFLILTLLVLALKRGKLVDLSHPIVAWSIGLTATWAVVYGFVCFHNLGTSVRYRLQIFPVLIGLLLFFARDRAQDDPDQSGEEAEAAVEEPTAA